MSTTITIIVQKTECKVALIVHSTCFLSLGRTVYGCMRKDYCHIYPDMFLQHSLFPSSFQACLYFAAAFQAVACGIHYLASVFLVETPNFVCSVPGNITDILYGNLTGSSLEEFLPALKPGTGPLVVRTAGGEQWELSRCSCAQRINPTDFTYQFDGNRTVRACDGTFVYDHSEVQQSIVTDWDLVCEREWLAKLCQPSFMLGVLIGALLFGDLADR